MAFYIEIEKYAKIFMKPEDIKKPQQSRARIKWRYYTFLISNYTNPNNMELSCKQTYRPMKQNGRSRNEHVHIRPTNFQQQGKNSLFKSIGKTVHSHEKALNQK